MFWIPKNIHSDGARKAGAGYELRKHTKVRNTKGENYSDQRMKKNAPGIPVGTF